MIIGKLLDSFIVPLNKNKLEIPKGRFNTGLDHIRSTKTTDRKLWKTMKTKI